MSNILLIPEKGLNKEDAWYPWLEKELTKRNHKLLFPVFPENANIEEWVSSIKEVLKFFDAESMIIGHGFGVKVALKVLEQKTRTVAAAFFVAGKLDDEQYDFENVKSKAKEFFVYASDNDSLVLLEETEHLASMVGESVLPVPDAGHFDKNKEFEDILVDIISVVDSRII